MTRRTDGLTRVLRGIFNVATGAFPSRFEEVHGPDMRDAFATQLEVRRTRRGRRAAVSYTARAVLDALRQGTKERTRGATPPGHGRGADEEGTGMWDGIGTDLRLALRGLRRSPGFTAAATTILALGIGANTTVFSALRTAVLAPPPYDEPERLVIADLTMEHLGRGTTRTLPWSFPKYGVFREIDDRLIDPAAGYATRNATLSSPGDPTQIDVEVISPGYFEILGIRLALGRTFGSDEDVAGTVPLVTILSHELWATRFGADPSVLGRSVTLNGHDVRIVGVAPRGFDGLAGGARAWVPMLASGTLFNSFMLRGAQAHWFHVVGRLRPGVEIGDAATQMEVIGEAVAEAYPGSDPNRTYRGSARLLTEVRVNDRARASVWLLTGAALLVLLVACANLSGLLLARARRAARDGAVRLSVGASRWRLVRASLAESLVLSAGGGILGVAVAIWGVRGLAALWPRQFLSSGTGEMRVMNPESLVVDGGVLAFSIGATLLTAVLFGLGPALRSSRTDPAGTLREGGSSTRRAGALLGLDGRAALVGTQVALALMLLIGTGLVGTSMLRMLEVDRGFSEGNVLVFSYAIPRSSPTSAEPVAFHDEFLARIRRLQGVEGATVGCAPLRGHCWGITRVDAVEGKDAIPSGEGPEIGITMVGDTYFEVLGIPLVGGRTLDQTDGTDAFPTMVVNRRAADVLFPGEDPIGKRIQIGVGSDEKEDLVEIVGIVENVLYDAPDQEQFLESYYSYREFPDASVTALVRTAGDPMDALPAIRAELAIMDPTLAMSGITTVQDVVARSVGDRRIIFELLAAFALVTVLLSAAGTWGIVAYSIADRRKELGLRLALGAGASRVLSLVVGGSMRAAAVGVMAGAGGAWAGAKLLNAFLFQTSPRDPAAFAAGTLLLLAVVLAASYLPARRAASVDPVEALKSE